MTSDTLEHAKHLVDLCSRSSRRMPVHAARLVRAVELMDGAEKDELRQYMQNLEPGVNGCAAAYMAHRAAAVAPHNLRGATHIINALVAVLGGSEALRGLSLAGYQETLLHHASRFATPKRNQLRLAEELCLHVRHLYGRSNQTDSLLSHIDARRSALVALSMTKPSAGLVVH